MGFVLTLILILFVLGPIAQAYAKRVRTELPPDARRALADMESLRREVEQLQAQVGRLQEEQHFMVRLLSEGDRRQLEQRRPDEPQD